MLDGWKGSVNSDKESQDYYSTRFMLSFLLG